jgi:hypothetical protein
MMGHPSDQGQVRKQATTTATTEADPYGITNKKKNNNNGNSDSKGSDGGEGVGLVESRLICLLLLHFRRRFLPSTSL